jgi:SAM-dependent methyltransferase
VPDDDELRRFRQRALVFEEVAEAYDRIRPGYPDALIEAVLGPLPRGIEVLDIACGTGIASRSMQTLGARVLGVELNPGMAQVAERHGIAVELSRFEDWDPAGRTFDRATCAQAWHWLEPGPSLEKAAAVLRPGGRLCLFWSIGHHPDDLADELREAYHRVLPDDSPMAVGYAGNRSSDLNAEFNLVVDAMRTRAEWDEPTTTRFPWSRTYSKEQWLDELGTHSDHAALDPELRAALFDEVGRVIDDHGGSFEMPYVTVLVSASRT